MIEQVIRDAAAWQATRQTPGSPTPGFISDWPAGHYSGDAAGRGDLATGPKRTNALDVSLERIEDQAQADEEADYWERELLAEDAAAKEAKRQAAKELFDQVTAAPGVLKIAAEQLLPIEAAHEPYLQEVEGRLVANAAQHVHKEGRQFDGWPTVTRTYLRHDFRASSPTYFRGFVLTDRDHAEHIQLRLDGWTAPR